MYSIIPRKRNDTADMVQLQEAISNPIKPIYRLNRYTDTLEHDGDDNIQEFINSNRDTALANVLDMFLPSVDGVDNGSTLSSMVDLLDTARTYKAKCEDYRDKFDMPLATDEEIISFVAEKAKIIKEDIKNVFGKKVGVDDRDQVVVKDIVKNDGVSETGVKQE